MNKLLLWVILIFSIEASAERVDSTDYRNKWYYIDLGYRFAFPTAVCNTGKGFCFDLGFKPTYFFNTDIELGVFVGVTNKGRFWDYKYTEGFRYGAFSNYDSSQLTSHERNYGYEFTHAISNPDTRLLGDVIIRYGIIIGWQNERLPILKIYRGTVRTLIEGNRKYSRIPLDEKGRFSYAKPLTFGVEIIFLKGIHVYYHSRLMLGEFSVFFETVRYDKATINGIPVELFFNEAYISHYYKDKVFGFKIGLNFM